MYLEAKSSGFNYLLESQNDPKLTNEDLPSKVQIPAFSNDSIKLQTDQGTVLVPAYKKGYSLLYGTELIYIVVKMVSTIYERLLKAK